jgi:hypothetical protein
MGEGEYKRFPDDRVDNERFTGSAAAWVAVIFLGFVLFFIVIGIVAIALIH